MLVAAACTDEVQGGAKAAPAPVPERWRIDYASDSTNATLFDVAPVSKDEGWAIGQTSSDFVLLRRRGGRWQPADMPLPATRALFNIHLAASAPDNVWLFTGITGSENENGDSSETPAARRWDGHQWRTIPVDFTTLDVAVVSPTDVWVLDSGLSHGRPLTRHWDGRRWTEYVLPYPTKSLSVGGPHDVWAVGMRDDPAGKTQFQPAAMRFDGTAWQAVPMPVDRGPNPKPTEQSTLTKVVAVGPDNVWAFGDHDDDVAATGAAAHHTIIVLHWDGATWRTAPSAPKYTVDIHSFPDMTATGDGAGGFVMGGYQHGTANGTLRVIGYPAPPPATAQAPSPTGQFEVNDLQLVPGAREVWATGVMEGVGSGNYARAIIASCALNG